MRATNKVFDNQSDVVLQNVSSILPNCSHKETCNVIICSLMLYQLHVKNNNQVTYYSKIDIYYFVYTKTSCNSFIVETQFSNQMNRERHILTFFNFIFKNQSNYYNQMYYIYFFINWTMKKGKKVIK